MAVLEINDWDDSVTILFVRKEGRENGKKIAVLKKNDWSDLPHPQIPQHLLKSLINRRMPPPLRVGGGNRRTRRRRW